MPSIAHERRLDTEITLNLELHFLQRSEVCVSSDRDRDLDTVFDVPYIRDYHAALARSGELRSSISSVGLNGIRG